MFYLFYIEVHISHIIQETMQIKAEVCEHGHHWECFKNLQVTLFSAISQASSSEKEILIEDMF